MSEQATSAPEEQQPIVDISPAAILNATQTQRMMIISQGMGAYVDKDYAKILKDADQTALGQLRIQSDNENAAAERDVAMAIAQSIGRTQENPFMVQAQAQGQAITANGPTPPTLTEAIQLPADAAISEENVSDCSTGSPDLSEVK